LTGCRAPGSPGSGNPDWQTAVGRDLNCADDRIKVIGGRADEHDIDGDGTKDFFVTMRCTSTAPGSPKHSQLEVFRGGSDPANPTRLAVIVRAWQGYELTGCVAYVEGRIYTLGRKGAAEQIWEVWLDTSGEVDHVVGGPSEKREKIIGCA
jgi:hypothetical protein